tara:strand:- start:1246 stop:1551 length:306 start_codon:yes stop_codon:yes gene_type:complete
MAENVYPIDREISHLKKIVHETRMEFEKALHQLSAIQLCIKSMEKSKIEITDDGIPVFIPPKKDSALRATMEHLNRRDENYYKLAKEQGLVGRTDIVIEEE